MGSRVYGVWGGEEKVYCVVVCRGCVCGETEMGGQMCSVLDGERLDWMQS